jgi:subtilase family serine protease
VISISYGACEAEWGAANLNAVAQLGQQANTQGQTLVAAAGDLGAADCDAPAAPGSMRSVAARGLAVDAPASLPSATGMGGSEFDEGSGNYWKPVTNGMDLSPSALS